VQRWESRQNGTVLRFWVAAADSSSLSFSRNHAVEAAIVVLWQKEVPLHAGSLFGELIYAQAHDGSRLAGTLALQWSGALEGGRPRPPLEGSTASFRLRLYQLVAAATRLASLGCLLVQCFGGSVIQANAGRGRSGFIQSANRATPSSIVTDGS
jgi:hypothetical protein